MAHHTLAFELPAWRRTSRTRWQPAFLLFATLVWLIIYSGLGWRFWTRGLNRFGPFELWMLLACIVLGAALVLAWRASWRRLWQGWRVGGWPALDLNAMYALTPSEFEDYVARRIFARKGYKVVNIRDTKDGGVDIMVTDRFGQRAVVQCKRYKGSVGEPIVRDLYGTMLHVGAGYGFLVTTSTFSEEARRWAAGKPIELIDGRRLVELSRS
jgi:restriction system protein